jgi:D-psicose/D-tagatose/L-ribulose 3-epimerase
VTNPIGVHALVWVGDTSPASVTQAVTRTRDAGFDLLEFSLHDSLNMDVAAARRELEEAGLAVACSRGLAFDADVSSGDPAVVDRGAQLLHDSAAEPSRPPALTPCDARRRSGQGPPRRCTDTA